MLFPVYILLSLLSIFQREEYNCQCYANDLEEVVCLNDEIIIYRLRNGGGLVTYTIGKGTYKRKNLKYSVKHEYIDLLRIDSISNNSKDSVKMQFIDLENSPIVSALITIYKHKSKSPLIQLVTDNEGFIKFKNEFSNQSITFHIGDIYLSSIEQKMTITPGFDYVLTSKVSTDFTAKYENAVERRYLKINIIGDTAVISDSFDKYPRKFYKIKSEEGHDCCYHSLIYQSDNLKKHSIMKFILFYVSLDV